MNSKNTNFKQVTEAAHGSFEELEMEFIAEEEGYVMAYTSNQTNENLNVFMDDMLLIHTTGPIIRVDDYYPFGLTFNSSTLDNRLTNKFLYNGKEKEELTNWYDYGARMYMPDIGRWGVIDPLADEYHSISPSAYVANDPINLIDPNGMEIVNPSEKELQVIIDDLNRIYKEKYGVENAFNLQKRERTKKVQTNKFSISDPSTWFADPEYEEVTVTDYVISKNEDFDWETDEYTQGMSDLIDAESDVYLDIVKDNGDQYKKDVPLTREGLLKDYGGGYTVNSRRVILSNKLSKSEGNNKKSKWTFGSLALHELLYHIHPLGIDEGSPNKMRGYYMMRKGRSHPAGNNQIRSLKEKKR